MRFLILALFLAHFLALTAQASLLTFQPGANEIEKVKISNGASGIVENQAIKLTTVGSGLRYKKVAFVKASVYVGELLVEDPSKFVRTLDGALPSIDLQNALAIRMTMLRDVDAKKMMEAFQEGLKMNGISMDREVIKDFLAAVQAGAEAKEGKAALVLIFKNPAGGESLIYEDFNGKITFMNAEKGLARTIFSIWLGKMDDAGLESLRKSLIGY